MTDHQKIIDAYDAAEKKHRIGPLLLPEHVEASVDQVVHELQLPREDIVDVLRGHWAGMTL